MDSREKVEAELAKVKKIDGVKALPPSSSRKEDLMSQGDYPAKLQSILHEAPDGEFAAFLKAGWSFVEESSNRAEAGNSVYRRSDGQIVIAGPTLNVRLAENLSDEECRNFLSELGLSVKRQLKFAPNLFVVVMDEERSEDLVSLCLNLMSKPQVLYAEPSFIENLSGRNSEQP
ncbi:MAG: hypothetical protein K2Y39_09590 [Candidatus Obscuribacterales bacterium]|nr:hypothetical protein [Candidatus Obscuribacterales bacterium]